MTGVIPGQANPSVEREEPHEDDWQNSEPDPDEEDTAALLWQQELESHL